MRFNSVIAIIVVSALAASAGAFPTPVGIYSNLAGHPTNVVPGLGISFNPGTGTQFDRPYRSADGTKWILVANANTGNTATQEVIITGSGTTGTLQAQEGVTVIEPGRLCDSAGFDQRLSINNAGNFSFACSLDGATTDDEVIVKSVGGSLSISAREGQAIGGLIAGATLGTTLDSQAIDSANKVSFRTTLTGVPAGQTTAVLLGDMGSVAAQTGVTMAGNGFTWSTLTAGDMYYSPNGTDWLTHGDTNDPVTTQDYLGARNNSTVLFTEGTSPGAGMNGWTLTNAEIFMSPDGAGWISRGQVATSLDDFISVNGTVVAKTGDQVPGAPPGEFYDDAAFGAGFFHMAMNNQGQYTFGSVTNSANLDANAVITYFDGVNFSTILREGDPVDLNGNGLLDDNVYLSVFNDFDGFLSEDGYFYFFADLRDNPASPFTNVGQAFMRVQVPEPATMGLLAIGALLLGRRRSKR